MPDYADWTPDTIEVLDLQLDPLNPRIPYISEKPTERQLIEQLLEHEDVLELARSIGEQGYYPTEVLVCIENAGGFVVVEGNRRAAALKLLHSPELASAKFEKKIASLSSKHKRSTPDKIQISVAPDRAATVPLIMNRHTRVGVKNWEPLQQAQYTTSLLSAGLTLDQIPVLTGISRGEIVKNLRTNALYEMAKRLPLDSKSKAIVSDPRKFSASILERVSGSPEARSFLGIDFDDVGGVVGKVAPGEFAKAYIRIVTDVAHKRIDTRKLNNAADVKQYLKTLNTLKPNRNIEGSFSSEDFLNEERKEEQSSAPPSEPKPRKQRSQKGILPRGFKCNLPIQRIKDVCQELKDIDIKKHENAVGILLRIFIELSVSHYMEVTEQMMPLIEKIAGRSKQGKPKDWTPTLRQMLGHLTAHDTLLTSQIPRQALKAINKAIADDDHPLSLDGMDQFAHNPYVAPNEKQLKQMWNAFEAMMHYMMDEHDPVVEGV